MEKISQNKLERSRFTVLPTVLWAEKSGLESPSYRLWAEKSGLESPSYRLRAGKSGSESPPYRLRLQTAPMDRIGMRQKGVFLIELIVAMLVIVTGLIMILNLVGSMAVMSVKSRNRIYAEILARSMTDRIKTHEYGAPEPVNWTEDEIVKVIPETDAGNALKGSGDRAAIEAAFKKKVEYDNGSFVGKSDKNFDTVTVTISWQEAKPGRQLRGEGDKEDSSQLRFDLEVRKIVPDQGE